MGRLNEAESILRRSTSPDAKVYIALSEISRQRKRYAEAHLFAAKALRLTRVAAVSPDGASAEAGARYQLACVEWAEGDLAGAARNLESALSVLDARGSVDALNTVTIISALGLLKLQTGKLSEARALLQRAKDLANRGGDRPALALVLHRSAAVAERAKDLPSAEALLRQSLLLGDEIWGIHSSQSALCVADLVRILVQQRKFSDAELLSRRVDATHSSGAEPAWIPVLALRVKLLSKLKRKEEAALIGSRLKTILSAYPTQAAQQVDIIEMFRSVP
jgi:tetratricopeptide (TPR) repeat protein